MRYGDLLSSVAIRYLGFVDMCWDHHEQYLVVCRIVKLGWNRHSSFSNIKLLIFYDFGLKMCILATKWGFWSDWPQSGD